MTPKSLLFHFAGLLLVTAIWGSAVNNGLKLRRGFLHYVDYSICIKTGMCSSAGTDANVKIRLYGPNFRTQWVELDDPNRDDFEYGSRDCFPFRAINVATKVEDIKSIEVKQFRHAEKWCIDNIDLTFDEKTKKFGEIVLGKLNI